MSLQLLLIAMICGACQVMQALTNGSAAQAGLGAIWVGAISACVSALSLVLVALFVQQGPLPTWGMLESQGPKALLGGLMGAFIVSGLTFVTPKLGPSQTFLIYFGIIVTVSLIVDSFGLFGMRSTLLHTRQLVGVGVAAAGLLLARS